jgi:D-sedoheptulose 7-phosphate isomerase
MSPFYKKLNAALSSVLAIENIEILKNSVKTSKRVFMIGNGGSNAIASHISVDYSKWLKIPTFGFTDSSILTAYFNDFGNENVYVEFLKSHTSKDDLVILMSSSGNSPNIVNCVSYRESISASYILLTGFSKDNRARKEIKNNCILDVWVNSGSYGIVELAHESFLHSIVDN